jgi:hypothetical protein
MEKLFNYEFHDVLLSPNIITCVINSRTLGRARHVTRMGEKRNA